MNRFIRPAVVVLSCLSLASCAATAKPPIITDSPPAPIVGGGGIDAFRDALIGACQGFIPTAASIAALYSAFGGSIQLAATALCNAVSLFKSKRAVAPGVPATLVVKGVVVKGTFRR